MTLEEFEDKNIETEIEHTLQQIEQQQIEQQQTATITPIENPKPEIR